jgi:hypothetical protein
MRFRLPIFAAFSALSAVTLSGCAVAPSDDAATPLVPDASRIRFVKVRERELQTTWRGKSYTALVEAYGMPTMIMNVPGFRPLKTSVAVYDVRDNSSRCIDAFTVVKHGITGEWTVADYFCR